MDDVSELTTALPFGEKQAKASRDTRPVRSEARRDEFVVEDLIGRAERRRMPGHLRWAAGVLLMAVAAGAAYAAPGSPVQRWIDGLTGTVDVPAPENLSEAPDVAGVVVPVGDRLEIELRPQGRGTIDVILDEVSDVTVEAFNGSATFDSRADRLVVEGADGPDYRITIPRDAVWIEVLIGATPVFRLESGEVVTNAQSVAAGRYRIAFSDVSPSVPAEPSGTTRR